MCRLERWSVRALRQKIDGMLYERTAISRKQEAVIRHELDTLRAEDRMSPARNGLRWIMTITISICCSFTVD